VGYPVTKIGDKVEVLLRDKLRGDLWRPAEVVRIGSNCIFVAIPGTGAARLGIQNGDWRPCS